MYFCLFVVSFAILKDLERPQFTTGQFIWPDAFDVFLKVLLPKQWTEKHATIQIRNMLHELVRYEIEKLAKIQIKNAPPCRNFSVFPFLQLDSVWSTTHNLH